MLKVIHGNILQHHQHQQPVMLNTLNTNEQIIYKDSFLQNPTNCAFTVNFASADP